MLAFLYFCAALFGITLVLFPNLNFSEAIPGITGITLFSALISPIAISLGSVWQKAKVQSLNLWVSTSVQFVGGALCVGILSFLLENQHIEFTTPVTFALLWLTFVLSIGAVALLMFLIRKDSSSSVASLFFLVPVVAMAMTWALFDEQLNWVQIGGSLIVVVSVALALRKT